MKKRENTPDLVDMEALGLDKMDVEINPDIDMEFEMDMDGFELDMEDFGLEIETDSEESRKLFDELRNLKL